MEVGFLGHPRHGYETAGLLEKLDAYFGMDKGIRTVLVGVGNLGRAVLGYFVGKQSHITVEAAFDTDPEKVGRVLHGCRCYPVSELPAFLAAMDIHVGMIAVPASEAQKTAEMLVAAGVRSLVNFAPSRLRVPPGIFVEELDVTLGIEKAAYFAKISAAGQPPSQP
jgi:redox-sensing transcriptional repressor